MGIILESENEKFIECNFHCNFFRIWKRRFCNFCNADCNFLESENKRGSMSDNSAIEWTDATWNPTTGCTKVSTGCDRCYAERIALRFGRSFDLELHPDRLEQPLTWRRPRRVFVNSVSDLFHRDVPWGFVDQVFGVMEAAEHHTYQLLTKRSSAMRDYLRSRYAGRECPPHIWCGVSVEDRKALARVKHLQESPASLRFLSCEPLIGGLDLSPGQLTGIAWVIVRGESGPGARPMSPDWARGFRLPLVYGVTMSR